jgi:hypothetical protein
MNKDLITGTGESAFTIGIGGQLAMRDEML